MSSAKEAKKIARQFINDQKRILEEFGDSAVPSKCKAAIASAERTFLALVSKPKKSNGNVDSHDRS